MHKQMNIKKTLPTKKTNKEKNPIGLKNLLGSMDFFEATTDKKNVTIADANIK